MGDTGEGRLVIPFEHRATMIAVRLHELEADLLRQLAEQLIVLLGQRAPAAGDSRDGGSSESTGLDAVSAATLLAQLGIGGATTPPLDPALARLLPDAYRDDRAASSEHRRLTEFGLVDRKIAHAHTVVATLAADQVELDETAAQSWLRTLTDLRLTLAARLHIDDDSTVDDDTGDEAMRDVYDWLGYLQGMLVETIEQIDTDIDEVNHEL